MLTSAVRVASLLNRYLIYTGSPPKITIPHASQLAKIQEITLRGIFLKNQTTRWNPGLLNRSISQGRKSGRYLLRDDGSVEFCIGTKALQPHIVCRLFDASPWLFLLNESIGKRIAVAGYLRCSFEMAGFGNHDNAHIFEIHPIHTLEIDGQLHSMELSVPNSLVRAWTPELSELDERRELRYWKGRDALVFSNVATERDTYVRVSGQASEITLNNSTNRPAWFLLSSLQLQRQVKVTCLQGTRAARRLRDLTSTSVSVIGLRSIDLARALEDRYRINLIAFDVESA
jgi:hypothetical protein